MICQLLPGVYWFWRFSTKLGPFGVDMFGVTAGKLGLLWFQRKQESE